MPGSPIRPLWTPAFASVAYALFVVLLGSNLATPLWNLYQARYGLTATGVTEVFVAYTLSLLVMLLIGGWVSDRLGRRTIILPAVTVAMAGGAVSLGARGPQWLLAGRALAGLAAGGLIVAGTAALTELAPAGGRARASVVASSATVAGLAAGPLLTGLLAQYAPYPDRLVFGIYVLVTLPALPALAPTYRPDPAAAAAPRCSPGPWPPGPGPSPSSWPASRSAAVRASRSRPPSASSSRAWTPTCAAAPSACSSSAGTCCSPPSC